QSYSLRGYSLQHSCGQLLGFGYKHSRKNNPALSIVGADLRVCPGRGVRRDTGADTQVCPYDKHRKIFAPLLMISTFLLGQAGAAFILTLLFICLHLRCLRGLILTKKKIPAILGLEILPRSVCLESIAYRRRYRGKGLENHAKSSKPRIAEKICNKYADCLYYYSWQSFIFSELGVKAVQR